MRFEWLAARFIIAYEFCRFFMLVISHPLQDITLLTASWYAATPLLVLPVALAVLLLFDAEHFGAYQKLYILAKVISAAGIVRYIVTAYRLMRVNGTLITDYSVKLLVILLIFCVIDVILAIYEFFRKGGSTECK
jgi:hypothetical protein